MHDRYAMALYAHGADRFAPVIVGHLPLEISRELYFFQEKHGGKLEVTVQSTARRPSPIIQGGLEIAVELVATHPENAFTNKLSNMCATKGLSTSTCISVSGTHQDVEVDGMEEQIHKQRPEECLVGEESDEVEGDHPKENVLLLSEEGRVDVGLDDGAVSIDLDESEDDVLFLGEEETVMSEPGMEETVDLLTSDADN